MLIGLLGALMLGSSVKAAAEPELQTAAGLQQGQDTLAAASTEPDSPLIAARRKVLTQILDQLQQQARTAEGSVGQNNAAADPQAQPVDAQALHAQIQNVQQQLSDLTRVGPGGSLDGSTITSSAERLRRLDAQMQQLTRQREDLARALQQLRTQLQQVPPNQEPGRRWMQGELDRLQGQLRDIDQQLTTLRQERLRADYAATLQAHRQAQTQQATEAANQAAVTAQQVANLTAQLQQLRELAQRNQQELEQLQDQSGPHARELQATLEGLQQQMQTVQGRLRAMEQERVADKLQAADRQRQTLDSYVQQLGRRQEELTKSLASLQQQLRALQDQMRQMEQGRAAGEESVRRTTQQGVEQLRVEALKQQEELRNQIRSLDERLRAATEHAGTGTEAFRKELDSLRTDLQRMSQTMGRLERERLDAQAALQGRIQQLETQVSELRKDVALAQGTLNMMLSQMGRSTVGSAGYTWGW